MVPICEERRRDMTTGSQNILRKIRINCIDEFSNIRLRTKPRIDLCEQNKKVINFI